MEVASYIIATIGLLLAGFFVTVAYEHWKAGAMAHAIGWGLGTWVVAGIAVAAGAWPIATKVGPGATERPWVTVSTANLLTYPALGVNPVVRVELLNAGKSPAFEVVTAGEVFSRATTAALELPQEMTVAPPSRGLLGVNTVYSVLLDSTQPFTLKTQVDAVIGGRNTLYATGQVHYKDKDGRKYRTDFCLKTSGNELQLRTAAGEIPLAACAAGNVAK